MYFLKSAMTEPFLEDYSSLSAVSQQWPGGPLVLTS